MPHNSVFMTMRTWRMQCALLDNPCTKHCMFQSEMSFRSDESKVCGTVGSGMFGLDFSWWDHDRIVRAITGMFHTSWAAWGSLAELTSLCISKFQFLWMSRRTPSFSHRLQLARFKEFSETCKAEVAFSEEVSQDLSLESYLTTTSPRN